MKRLFLFILFCAVGTLGMTQNSFGDIVGEWYGEEQDRSTFVVTKNSDGVYKAVVTASEEPDNIGEVVFEDVRYDAESKTWKGTLTPPGRSISVNAEFTLVSKEKLQVDGKMAFITRSFVWERVENKH